MKKLISKIGVIIMALGLFGCSADISSYKGEGPNYSNTYKVKLLVQELFKIIKVRLSKNLTFLVLQAGMAILAHLMSI